MQETGIRYFHISNKDLVYLKFVLEAYEGFAILSTENARNGIVRISAPNAFKGEVEILLQELRAEIAFFEVYPPDFGVGGSEIEFCSEGKYHA